ncbi:Protein kinase domain [Carpediemonas membranifera]|uniref:Protein kinase domain n=1 Tax=Carpediemonas membranifera TaxID=201153 RepID=A0A8J6B1A7_9EUKA|nr:Protein kinase domain [Carpediemonas membranifera]|eukprot:KAG9390809.1 Protein kinase domain [Carpediemonas membranifera]
MKSMSSETQSELRELKQMVQKAMNNPSTPAPKQRQDRSKQLKSKHDGRQFSAPARQQGRHGPQIRDATSFQTPIIAEPYNPLEEKSMSLMQQLSLTSNANGSAPAFNTLTSLDEDIRSFVASKTYTSKQRLLVNERPDQPESECFGVQGDEIWLAFQASLSPPYSRASRAQASHTLLYGRPTLVLYYVRAKSTYCEAISLALETQFGGEVEIPHVTVLVSPDNFLERIPNVEPLLFSFDDIDDHRAEMARLEGNTALKNLKIADLAHLRQQPRARRPATPTSTACQHDPASHVRRLLARHHRALRLTLLTIATMSASPINTAPDVLQSISEECLSRGRIDHSMYEFAMRATSSRWSTSTSSAAGTTRRPSSRSRASCPRPGPTTSAPSSRSASSGPCSFAVAPTCRSSSSTPGPSASRRTRPTSSTRASSAATRTTPPSGSGTSCSSTPSCRTTPAPSSSALKTVDDDKSVSSDGSGSSFSASSTGTSATGGMKQNTSSPFFRLLIGAAVINVLMIAIICTFLCILSEVFRSDMSATKDLHNVSFAVGEGSFFSSLLYLNDTRLDALDLDDPLATSISAAATVIKGHHDFLIDMEHGGNEYYYFYEPDEVPVIPARVARKTWGIAAGITNQLDVIANTMSVSPADLTSGDQTTLYAHAQAVVSENFDSFAEIISLIQRLDHDSILNMIYIAAISLILLIVTQLALTVVLLVRITVLTVYDPDVQRPFARLSGHNQARERRVCRHPVILCLHVGNVDVPAIRGGVVAVLVDCEPMFAGLAACDRDFPVGRGRGVAAHSDDADDCRTFFNFRPPENMWGCTHYGSATDMWSVVAIFAHLLRREYLFLAETEHDLLEVMASILPPMDDEFKAKARETYPAFLEPTSVQSQTFRSMFPAAPNSVLDMLHGLLTWDPDKRWTAEQCLNSAYMTEAPAPTPPSKLPRGEMTGTARAGERSAKAAREAQVQVLHGGF